MTKTILHPVILCGGSATRLWPLSRAAYPKQLLSLAGQKSMLQATIERAMGLAGNDLDVRPPLLIDNQEHRFIIREQVEAVGQLPTALYLEPTGRRAGCPPKPTEPHLA